MSKNKFYYKNNNKKKFDAQNDEQKTADVNASKNPELMRPIEDLGLSEATYNALKAGKVNTLADLARRTFTQMYRIQNIGKKNCIEISKAMAKFGVKFAQDDNSRVNQNAKNAQPNNAPRDKGQNSQPRPEGDRSQQQFKQDRRDNKGGKGKKQRSESDSLNEYLSKQYAGMTINEILNGKRVRPVVEKIERPQLTETSLVKFCRKGKWGYKDWKGNVIVPPSYDEAFGFFEERACVEMDGKLGYIDRENNIVIDFKYDCATSFSEGLASVTVGEKSGYIDGDGNQVIDFIYDIATPFSGGIAIVRQNDRWGVLNRENLSVFWR